MNIPFPNSVMQTPLGAAVRDGRAYRTTVKGVINTTNPVAFYEFFGEAAATLIHDRKVACTSGPVEYDVYITYSLDTSPYIGSPIYGFNLNQLRQPVRPAQSYIQQIDPTKVLSFTDENYLHELVPSSETAGNHFNGMGDKDDLYNAYPQGARALVRVKTDVESPPDTKYVLRYITEEYGAGTLVP